LYPSPNTIKLIKVMWMKRAKHAVRIGDTRN